MIKLSRLNGKEFMLNAELIEQIESTPDTVITLSSGKTVMVKETVETVLKLVKRYKRSIQPSSLISNKNFRKSGQKNAPS